MASLVEQHILCTRTKAFGKQPKRSQILVPSFAVFQTIVLFAHVSLTNTAMPPLCFPTTPCEAIGLATSKHEVLYM
jgi:hypothetical protein